MSGLSNGEGKLSSPPWLPSSFPMSATKSPGARLLKHALSSWKSDVPNQGGTGSHSLLKPQGQDLSCLPQLLDAPGFPWLMATQPWPPRHTGLHAALASVRTSHVLPLCGFPFPSLLRMLALDLRPTLIQGGFISRS